MKEGKVKVSSLYIFLYVFDLKTGNLTFFNEN